MAKNGFFLDPGDNSLHRGGIFRQSVLWWEQIRLLLAMGIISALKRTNLFSHSVLPPPPPSHYHHLR